MTMVWLVSRSRLKVPPGTSSPYISPLAPSGQRNCASWASQPQKSVTLNATARRGDHESSYEHVVALKKNDQKMAATNDTASIGNKFSSAGITASNFSATGMRLNRTGASDEERETEMNECLSIADNSVSRIWSACFPEYIVFLIFSSHVLYNRIINYKLSCSV